MFGEGWLKRKEVAFISFTVELLLRRDPTTLVRATLVQLTHRSRMAGDQRPQGLSTYRWLFSLSATPGKRQMVCARGSSSPWRHRDSCPASALWAERLWKLLAALCCGLAPDTGLS